MIRADKALVVTCPMSSPRPSNFPTRAPPGSAWRRLSQWLPFETCLGIAPRLSIAFGAVAILALAANAITEHGIAILRTIETGSVAAPVADEQAGPDVLPVALDHFQRAALARVDSDDAVRVKVHREAAAALTAAKRAFATALATALDDASLGKLDSQVTAHKRLAVELVGTADARRRLLTEFNAGFESLDARMKASLDRTWKILGKVVARQYLVDANRMLDTMRKQTAEFAVPQGYSKETLVAIAASEGTLATILRDNERSAVRAFGQDWLAATRGDLDRLALLRESLVRTDRQREAGIERFSQSHAALSAQVRKTTAHFEAARAFAAAQRQSTDVLSAISAQKDRQRTVLAWLSACVLLLLFAISVNTVISVVMPVRRLLQATRRLAQGESGVIVPRGGIKELDMLAVSFNHMAEQLAAAQALARQYHGQLEAKVEQRTRQLQHLAEHDPLTRLPNRRQLLTQLKAALERAGESEGLVGVFFLDLDHFKNINDSMGHVFGDRVLQTIAERLRGVVADIGFSARLGGDEFTVVYEHATHLDEIQRTGRALVGAFQEPLIVDGRELLIGLSVGASVYPEHGRDPETLLRAADAALFRAKAQGRSQLSIFSPDLLEAAASKFATEQGLRRAMERGEFELFFQPEVNLATFETGLVEALLRWRLPSGAYARPEDFLQVAEDCGLVREIGDWVLQSAVEHAARWHKAAWPGVRVAVNVSSPQLLDSQFVDSLRELLPRHQLPPGCIEIELTENVLQTGHHTIEALRQLRAIGVGIALDDFGTGYSSLVSLEQLPLSRVKLDRSLIASIDMSTRSQAIARAIIALCQSLGLEITAEGVERREQLAWLLDHPAMYLQGYLLARPVPANDLLPTISEMPARLRSLLGPSLITSTAQFAEHRRARLRRIR
jgi:diguanylate cyclase (GGDEF)-like protein